MKKLLSMKQAVLLLSLIILPAALLAMEGQEKNNEQVKADAASKIAKVTNLVNEINAIGNSGSFNAESIEKVEAKSAELDGLCKELNINTQAGIKFEAVRSQDKISLEESQSKLKGYFENFKTIKGQIDEQANKSTAPGNNKKAAGTTGETTSVEDAANKAKVAARTTYKAEIAAEKQKYEDAMKVAQTPEAKQAALDDLKAGAKKAEDKLVAAGVELKDEDKVSTATNEAEATARITTVEGMDVNATTPKVEAEGLIAKATKWVKAHPVKTALGGSAIVVGTGVVVTGIVIGAKRLIKKTEQPVIVDADEAENNNNEASSN